MFLKEVRKQELGSGVCDSFLNSILQTLTPQSKSKKPRGGYESLAQEDGLSLALEDDVHKTVYRAPEIRDVLVRPVLAAVLNYGTLAILDIAYFAIITVFFAVSHSPSHHEDRSLAITSDTFLLLGTGIVRRSQLPPTSHRRCLRFYRNSQR